MGEEIKQGKAVLFGAAPCPSLAYLAGRISPEDFIFCADGGRRNAERLGLKVSRYVGDGDSGGYPEGVPSLVLPTEKDFSDMEAAVRQTLALGWKKLLLCCCTGGRADHFLSNCYLLEKIAEAGAEGRMVDERNELRCLLPGRYALKNDPPYRYLSLLPMERETRGVTLRGMKYPLRDATIYRGSTLTVSNEFLPGEPAELSFEAGTLLLVRSEPLW